MRTFKRCAVSNENPDYLIRNSHILIHKDAKEFFLSAERNKHSIRTPKPVKVINVEAKFGISGDNPYATQYSIVNKKIPTVFENEPKSYANRTAGFLTPIASHSSLKDALKESKGDTETFNKMMLKTQMSVERPMRKKIFSVLLRRSASQENQIKNSLLNPHNLINLRHSAKLNEENNYTNNLYSYISSVQRSTKNILRKPTKRYVSSTGTVFLLTEAPTKLTH